MKNKLTLYIDSKILQHAKNEAKVKAISISKLFEERMSCEVNHQKKRAALLRFKKLLKTAKPLKSKPRIGESMRFKHLTGKSE